MTTLMRRRRKRSGPSYLLICSQEDMKHWQMFPSYISHFCWSNWHYLLISRCNMSLKCTHFQSAELLRIVDSTWSKQPGCHSEPFFTIPVSNDWKCPQEEESSWPHYPAWAENREENESQIQKARLNKCFIELRHTAQIWVTLSHSHSKQKRHSLNKVKYLDGLEDVPFFPGSFQTLRMSTFQSPSPPFSFWCKMSARRQS